MKWISAEVNEVLSDDPEEGINELQEGDLVVLTSDGKWYKI